MSNSGSMMAEGGVSGSEKFAAMSVRKQMRSIAINSLELINIRASATCKPSRHNAHSIEIDHSKLGEVVPRKVVSVAYHAQKLS